MLTRLGAWAGRRAEPRLWISLAGAGCVLAVLGVLFISGDAQFDAEGNVDSQVPGILLCLAVVAAGYLLLYLFWEGPAATAGVTAIAVATPALAWFLTFDEDGTPPFSAEAILGLSTLVWLVSYLVGPGRGRPVLLGAGLVAAWLLALQLAEEPFSTGFEPTAIVEDGFGVDDPFAGDDPFEAEDPFGAPVSEPDLMTMAVLSLTFGAGYLAAARSLDRRGFSGTATPVVVASHVALPTGVALLAEDLEPAGAGAVFVVAGVVVAWFGARNGRRGSTIVGALEVGVGVVMILSDLMEDASPTSIGIALLLIGAAIALVAQLLHTQTGESPQMTLGPSTFSRARPAQPSPPWPQPQAPAPPPPPPPSS